MDATLKARSCSGRTIGITDMGSYCDLEQMLAERGVAVNHTTNYRWVQKCAREVGRRLRWQWRCPR